MLESVEDVDELFSRKRKRTSIGDADEMKESRELDLLQREPRPDSVQRMVSELNQLIQYVQERPQLQDGSASFMRDYIRTLLIKCAREADVVKGRVESQELNCDASEISEDESASPVTIESLDLSILKRIFKFADGKDLATVRRVSRTWKTCGDDPDLWKDICLRHWRSLETDAALWKFIDSKVSIDDEHRWRKIYAKVITKPRWTCKLQKMTKFVCNLSVYQIQGAPLRDCLPSTLRVDKRFDLEHLPQVITRNSPILYFEPETESDRAGFEEFIEYLLARARYSRDRCYEGKNLLGVVKLRE